MTDFGGTGNGAAVAESELNLPQLNQPHQATLTSSDLNELGCTTSTSAKSSASSSGISSGASSSSKSSGSAHAQHPHHRRSSVKSGSVLSVFRKSRSVSHHEHARRVLQENRSRSRKSQKEPPPRRSRSSSRIFIEILRTLTKGFSNCRNDRDDPNEPNPARRGSQFFSDLSNESKVRRKSHDGSQDGTNGSDSTSTGYVSDSSNEKHDEAKTGQKTISSIANQKSSVHTTSKIQDWAEKVVEQLDNPSPTNPNLVLPEPELQQVEPKVNFDGQQRRYVISSCSEEDLTGSEESFYSSGSESVTTDYEESSTYDDDTDDKEFKNVVKNVLNNNNMPMDKLGMIKEEDENTGDHHQDPPKKKNMVKRRRSTLKRKKTFKGEGDASQPVRRKSSSKLEDDNISRSGSLKDMIMQFETTMAELDINVDIRQPSENHAGKESPLIGVKAIAKKIQEQTEFDSIEAECMPPSQILKLKQALDLEPKEDLSQPVPLSRRSESKVAQIAKQLAEAERQRQQMEKAMARSGKSPKINKRQPSTSFINELLEMARAENSLKPTTAEAHPPGAPDFKQSLLAARRKITHREENITSHTPDGVNTSSEPTPLQTSVSACSLSSAEGGPGPNEIVDPFVQEVLNSKNVPEPVKQKIRIECWSLFNDPHTPKGVKQCILATMLSKVRNE